MVRSEAEVERLVGENQKLVHLVVKRYLNEAVPFYRLSEELGLSRQGIYAHQRIALRQLRAALSPAVTAGAL